MTKKLVGGVPLAEQIIAGHLAGGEGPVTPGRLVTVRPDRVYVQDGNAPTIARLYEQHGFTTVFDPERVSFVFDHSVLVADVDMADRMKDADRFAARLGVDVRARGQGISHVLAAEVGWFSPAPWSWVPTRTRVGGAFGALGLGMGASDIVAAMVTGTTWLRVPDTVEVRFTGTPARATRPRDVLLSLLRDKGQEPFLYRSVEFTGAWARSLSDDASASLASLGVELGAKCVFVPDEQGAIPTGTAPGLPGSTSTSAACSRRWRSSPPGPDRAAGRGGGHTDLVRLPGQLHQQPAGGHRRGGGGRAGAAGGPGNPVRGHPGLQRGLP
ncbi:aconitase family protein [Streptomyces nogalater]